MNKIINKLMVAACGFLLTACTVNPTPTPEVTLQSISLTDTHQYHVGETYQDANALVVIANYSDATAKTIDKTLYVVTIKDSKDADFALNSELKADKYTVNVSYNNVKNSYTINPISTKLTGITVKSKSGSNKFPQNCTITKDDFIVTASYDNASSATVTNFTMSSVNTSTVGTKTITFTYKENNISKSTTFSISIVKASLTKIEATYNGTKVYVGDSLNKNNFVVTATYDNGISKAVTNYSFVNFSSTTAGVKQFKISYTESSVTKTVDMEIEVFALVLESISATYTGGDISLGSSISSANLKVIANYEGGISRAVTNYTIGAFDNQTEGKKTVTISFTYEAVTKTTTIEVNVVAVALTAIKLSSSDLKIKNTEAVTLSVTYTPSNASYKDLTWNSSNKTVATVKDGVITPLTEGSTTITATSVKYASISATCDVVVDFSNTAVWTILMYISGNDLESDDGCATADIKEVLSVSNQPDDVNIVIQTGGAKSWSSTYGISSSYSQRWHVANKKLVKDEQNAKVNMGLSSTLEDFVNYGLTNFPANNVGLVLWNHGGAMQGVCYDEQYNDNSLLASEVSQALNNVYSKRSDKLAFIGYDACLMAVQDIAELNSHYADYMVSSEESEWGYGWAYDGWIDDVYAKKTPDVVCKAIVDSFYSSLYQVTDQTLSYLDLSKAETYLNAWETMSKYLLNTTLKNLGTNAKSKLATLVKSSKHFGDSDYTYFGTFDAKDFLNKMKSSSDFAKSDTTLSGLIDDAITAYGNLVAYSKKQSGAGNANGLAMFYSVSSNCNKSSYYSSSQTNFTNWRSINLSYGY